MCFHTANAWEEGPNTIRLFLCTFREFRWGAGGGRAGAVHVQQAAGRRRPQLVKPTQGLPCLHCPPTARSAWTP